MHVFLADSSIVNSGQSVCYQSDNSTDQCSDGLTSDSFVDGLNACCGGRSAAATFGQLNWYYSLNGAVDCEACELFKYPTINYIFLTLAK